MVVNQSLYSRPEYKLVVVNKKVSKSEIDVEVELYRAMAVLNL